MSHSIKKLTLTIVINVLVFLLLAVVLEVGCWFFITRHGDNLADSRRVNHTWQPNSSWEHTEWIRDNPDFPKPYTHHYNSQGWLERYDVELQKPKDTYRIFYVGDSFTEGTAPMEGSLPSLVEASLNSTLTNSNYKIEVINTGTSSYAPTIFYTLIRYVILPYSPDLIVVNVDMSDDFDDWKYSQTVTLDEEGNPLAVPPRSIYTANYIDTVHGAVPATFIAKVQMFLLRNSFLYNLLSNVFAVDSQSSESNGASVASTTFLYKRWAWCEKEWDEKTTKNAERTLSMLQKIAAYCNTQGVKLVFSSVPHYQQLAGDDQGRGAPLWSVRPHKEIERVADENNIPYLDALNSLAPLVRGMPRSTYYYNGNMHFNPRGYKVWAKVHLDFLTAPHRNLLPPWWHARQSEDLE
ncbi:SGNH/GDSL hydrolase family protein [Oligoflexia bacterium]|nr:SGNH/GDSL hydrolase family protein [Oligoflexia bacterium]